MNRNILHFAEKRYTTSEVSSFEDDAAFSLPHYITLGFAWKRGFRIFLDNEIMFGKYGGKKLKSMEFWIVRTGIEKEIFNDFFLRFGLINPLIARTSTLGDIRKKLPNPRFTLSGGCGYNFNNISLDLAFFFNPGQSYVHRKPVPAMELSIGYGFK